MNDPLRERLISQLPGRLATIRKANGYFTDVKTVERFRLSPFDAPALPAISIYAVLDRPGGVGFRGQGPMGFDSRTVVVTLEFWLKIGSPGMLDTELNYFLADVYRAMRVDPTWGGISSDTAHLDVRQVALEQRGLVMGGMQADFGLDYRFPIGEPCP